jgi:glucokinase
MTDALYAGFDLGGTQLKYGLVNGIGEVLFKDQAESPKTIEGLLTLIRSITTSFPGREKKKIQAAGFGFAGFYSLKDRKILHSPNYPSLDNYAIEPALSGILEVPFVVNNDANMAAFGEWVRGAGMGAQSLILMTIGTGIGSGIILEGKLWQGKCGFAGELGHIVVNPEGEWCKCGIRGCLEAEAAGPKIAKTFQTLKKTKKKFTAREVYLQAQAGDEAAKKSFARSGHFLGIGLGIAINLLNPEKILLGGGVMAAGDYIFPPLFEEVRRRSNPVSLACCRIEKAILGNDAGFIGAGLWARQNVHQKSLRLPSTLKRKSAARHLLTGGHPRRKT